MSRTQSNQGQGSKPQTTLTYDGTLASNDVRQINLTEGDAEEDDFNQDPQQYAPLRNITFVNESSSPLKLKLNSERGYVTIPSNAIFQEDDVGVVSVRILNDSSSAASYSLSLNNRATVKSILRGRNR